MQLIHHLISYLVHAGGVHCMLAVSNIARKGVVGWHVHCMQKFIYFKKIKQEC
jgi:hypothetical protein